MKILTTLFLLVLLPIIGWGADATPVFEYGLMSTDGGSTHPAYFIGTEIPLNRLKLASYRRPDLDTTNYVVTHLSNRASMRGVLHSRDYLKAYGTYILLRVRGS